MSKLLEGESLAKHDVILFHKYVVQEHWTVFCVPSVNKGLCFVSTLDVAELFPLIFNYYLWDQTLASISLCALECGFGNETVDLIWCINCILPVIMLNGLLCARGVGRGEFASFTRLETWRSVEQGNQIPKTVGQRSAIFFLLIYDSTFFSFLPSFYCFQFRWISNALLPSEHFPGTSSDVQISLARESQPLHSHRAGLSEAALYVIMTRAPYSTE